MERLTAGASETSAERTSPGTSASTCSPGSADGTTPCDWPVGLTGDLFGAGPPPASRSAARGSGKGKTTTDTCGPRCSGSSESAALTACLENRLHLALDGIGSPEYALTWRHWDMRSGLPICALRASGHRTSGSGSTGWPSPTSQNARHATYSPCEQNRHRGNPHHDCYLAHPLEQEPYPQWVADIIHRVVGPELAAQETPRSCPKKTPELATTAGWATPAATEARQGFQDRSRGKKGTQESLTTQVVLQASGPTPSGSPAGTESRGALDPALPRWLMGYPPEWCDCAVTAMASLPRSRRRS